MSCSPLRMIIDNQLEEFDLSASPAAVNDELSTDNLTDELRSYVFRSVEITDTTTDFVQVISGVNTLGRRKAADGFAISGHNFTGVKDSYQLILKKQGEVVFDSGEIAFAVLIPLGIWKIGINYFGEPYDPAGLDQINVIWFPQAFYDEFEIRLTKRYFENPYRDYIPWIDVGHVFLGLSISPECNFSWGNELLWDHGQTLTRTQGGSLITEGGRDPHRELKLDLNYLTDRDRNLMSVAMRKSEGKAMLVAAYPESKHLTRETEYTMIAKRVPRSGWQHAGIDRHQHTLNLMEI